MAHKFFEDKRPHNGLDYLEFNKQTKNILDTVDPAKLEGKELNYYNYRKLNFQRTQRIHKTFNADENIKQVFENINQPQLWMILTEDWCGDSAQNLPYLFMLSELSDKITFKILERDKNLDIMDMYLTNEQSRSIPKLVAFDETGEELFTWGPRPKQLVELIKKLKNEGMEKEEWTKHVHTWYAKNKGKNLVEEIAELVNQYSLANSY